MNGKAGASRLLMVAGAMCFFGGIIAAAVGSAPAGVALVVVGVVLMLSSWAFLIRSVRGYRKDVAQAQAVQEQRISQVIQDIKRGASKDDS
jgi:ABC-type dipeptide/oligopeptide/nickel transport system permease subunit